MRATRSKTAHMTAGEDEGGDWSSTGGGRFTVTPNCLLHERDAKRKDKQKTKHCDCYPSAEIMLRWSNLATDTSDLRSVVSLSHVSEIFTVLTLSVAQRVCRLIWPVVPSPPLLLNVFFFFYNFIIMKESNTKIILNVLQSGFNLKEEQETQTQPFIRSFHFWSFVCPFCLVCNLTVTLDH